MAAEEALSVRGSSASWQRARLLSATFALVDERGYEGVSARSVSERAGVSSRTFYESFSDREDCFLAAFNYAVDGLESEARAGWESEPGWVAGVRAALALLLRALDREPGVSRLVFVEALGVGPRVLARRARVLEGLAGVVDGGRSSAKAPAVLAPLVAEGVVGGAFGVIHARLLELRPEPLIGLLGSLMAMIVLPYRGAEAAARELTRPVPRSPVRRRDGDGFSRRPLGSASPVDYRLTVRTQMALAAVAGRPGLNNREVSEVIGLSDQGQVSRMMKRLAGQGLVENAQGHVNANETEVYGEVPQTTELNSAGCDPTVDLGKFIPGVAASYHNTCNVTVTATGEENTLTASDESATCPGHLINGSYCLAKALETKATDVTALGGVGKGLEALSPVTLLSYPGPVSDDDVLVEFNQPIGIHDPLRTGKYGKTITLTLAQTKP